uniref:Retrotransposon gag domain-containing protein n=1 Tax=Amphimedon queenslandica TaxID=400682 RepID=A0A1X7U4B0_AMPQE
MEQFQPPEPLLLQGNLAENWRRWKQRFSIYMTASRKKDESEEVNPNDAVKLSKLLDKFEEYCISRKNITWERHVFNTRNQQPDETVDQYVRRRAKTCEFGALTESLIRDRLVGGIISNKMRSCLLKKADLTLKDALDICCADEAVSTQFKKMSNSTTTMNEHEVNFMKKKQPRQHSTRDSSSLYSALVVAHSTNYNKSAPLVVSNAISVVTSTILLEYAKPGKLIHEYKTLTRMMNQAMTISLSVLFEGKTMVIGMSPSR